MLSPDNWLLALPVIIITRQLTGHHLRAQGALPEAANIYTSFLLSHNHLYILISVGRDNYVYFIYGKLKITINIISDWELISQPKRYDDILNSQ